MKKIISKYKGPVYDYSCSEAILHAANEKYNLYLDENCFKMVAPFSGGLLTEDICGILTASITVLGLIFTNKVAHQSPLLKEATVEYIKMFKEELNSTNCFTLKSMYRDDFVGCKSIIIQGAEILEKVIEKYEKQKV